MAQYLRRCITKPTVVGSILADATAFTDFVPFSKVLKLDCLFPTHGCAEAFILQWIDTAWNLFYYPKIWSFMHFDALCIYSILDEYVTK